MSKKRRKSLALLSRGNEAETSFELDLSPMLALMVTLIPIMLLSTVFVRIALIETPLPQVVEKAIKEDRSKKDRQVNLVLDMNPKYGFKFLIQVNGQTKKNISIPMQGNAWNLEKLYKEALLVKAQHPKIFRLDLNPNSKVSYEEIVKVMDTLRLIKNGDKKVKIIDKETSQAAKTDIMFPDINFGNVVEG